MESGISQPLRLQNSTVGCQLSNQSLERGLTEHPLDSIPAIDRPYDRLVYAFSLLGRSDRAKAMLAAFDRRRAETALVDDDIARHAMLGNIALAEQQYEAAAGEFRASDATKPLPRVPSPTSRGPMISRRLQELQRARGD